jgi:hypothetical protein
MSQLRLGRNPDGTRRIVVDGPARGRAHGYGTGVSHPMTATEIRPVAEWRPEPRKESG